MNQNLKRKVAELAGPLRASTFVVAAEWVCQHPASAIIETGCYRGAACDGQSTLILALLAKETGGKLYSHELHEHNILKAKALLEQEGLGGFATFVCGNSGITLADAVSGVRLAYLDSYDFEEHKAIDAQAHQLVELGILLPKMNRPAAILLDDCDLPLGGKAGLSEPVMVRAGYRQAVTGYQKFFVHE